MNSPHVLALTIGLFIALPVCGCGGGQPKWGGMSEEQWRKQYQEKRAAEDREEAQAKVEVAAKEKAAAREKAAAKEEATATKEYDVEKPSKNRKAAEDRKRVFAGSARAYLMRDEESATKPTPPKAQTAAGVEKEEATPSPLPVSLDEWTEPDYMNARARGAEALPAAIRRLSDHTIGDEQTAELLVRLLSPPWEDESNGNRAAGRRSRRPSKRHSALVVEAIVAALAVNGTELAADTLEKLIRGQLSTEDDETAALATVKVLVDNPSLENDDLLLQLLTAPGELRRFALGTPTPEKLRVEAVELLGPCAPPRLRLKVAEHMTDPSTLPEERDLLFRLTDPAEPDALEAQLLLLRSPLIAARQKLAIEQQLARFSSEALAHVLGISERATEDVSASEWRRRVVDNLWSPPFSVELDRRLSEAISLKEEGQPLPLAATLPVDSARSSLYRTLRRRWADGPAEAMLTAFTDDLVPDPGLLVTMRVLLEEHSGEGGSQLPGRQARAAQPARHVARNARPADRVDWIKKVRDARREMLANLTDEWTATFDGLHDHLCDRLQSQPAGRPSGAPPELGDLSVELHADARVVAARHVRWGGAKPAEASISPADPMELFYVRMEETARPIGMLGTYRRRLKDCAVRRIENGVALERLQGGSRPGRKRLVSIRITLATPEIPSLPDEEQPLIVEVLSIEVNDPGGSSSKSKSLTES